MSKVSNFRASGSLARMATMMTSGAAQIHRNVMMGSRNALRGANTKDSIKAVVTMHMIGGALYGIFGNGFNLNTDEGKKDLVWSIGMGNTRGIALWGKVIGYVYDEATGKPWSDSSLTDTPVGSVMRKFMGAAIGFGRDYYDGTLTDEKKAKYIIDMVTGYAQLNGINLKEGIEIYQQAEERIEEGLISDDVTWAETLGLRTKYQQKKIDEIKGGDSGGFKKKDTGSSSGGFKKKSSSSSGGFKKK